MIKILAVVLAALSVVLGVHLVLELAVTGTLVGVFAVAARAMEYGVRCVPRARAA